MTITEHMIEAAAREFERVWNLGVESFDTESGDEDAFIRNAMKAALTAALAATPTQDEGGVDDLAKRLWLCDTTLPESYWPRFVGESDQEAYRKYARVALAAPASAEPVELSGSTGELAEPRKDGRDADMHPDEAALHAVKEVLLVNLGSPETVVRIVGEMQSRGVLFRMRDRAEPSEDERELQA